MKVELKTKETETIGQDSEHDMLTKYKYKSTSIYMNTHLCCAADKIHDPMTDATNIWFDLLY